MNGIVKFGIFLIKGIENFDSMILNINLSIHHSSLPTFEFIFLHELHNFLNSIDWVS